MCGRIAFISALAAIACAQPRDANYDESKVPEYKLPDPLIMRDGTPVRSAKTWRERRRPELLGLFATQMYGRTPAGRPGAMTWEVTSTDPAALGGNAVRKEVSIYFAGTKDGPRMDLLIYAPANSKRPVPVFLGLNFGGNQTVNADPGITISRAWLRDAAKRKLDRASEPEKTRGAAASRWPIETVLARGYAVATAYYGDISPDYDNAFDVGVHPLFYKPGQTRPAPDEWAAIGAWAWGLSRALDYIETDKALDAKRVAVLGHSRLGKTALWAGAQDERFAIVISNDSGEGGAALARRRFGERTADLVRVFPYWFCENFRKYAGKEDTLPFDQHELLALIAPRPVYVASAAEDLWADPKGEFLSALAASPVYKLLGSGGLAAAEMPPIHQPVLNGAIGYHMRAGKHDVTAYDWEQFMAFTDKHMR